MQRIKLTLEYDGSGYSGWQVQPGCCTVQGELEAAFRTILDSKSRGLGLPSLEKIVVQGSGRTDAGVHARAQVAHIDIPVEYIDSLSRLRYSLNGVCGSKLAVSSLEFVDSSFHARHTPHQKTYRYRLFLKDYSSGLNSGNSISVGSKLDLAKMISEARSFQGTHDFSAFRASDCCAHSTIRTVVSAELVRVASRQIDFLVQGKGFLKQMVRIMVGTLIEVGRGNIESVLGVIESLDRNVAGETAPARGLCLEKIRYED